MSVDARNTRKLSVRKQQAQWCKLCINGVRGRAEDDAASERKRVIGIVSVLRLPER